jgi:hypothetical protein
MLKSKKLIDYLTPRKQSQCGHLKIIFSSITSNFTSEIFFPHFGHLTIYHTIYKNFQHLNKNIDFFGGFN